MVIEAVASGCRGRVFADSVRALSQASGSPGCGIGNAGSDQRGGDFLLLRRGKGFGGSRRRQTNDFGFGSG